MSRRLLFAAAAVAFSAGALWSWQKSGNPSTASTAQTATPATDRALEQATVAQLMTYPWLDANQQQLTMAPLSGRVLVLNFWATWCAPCVEEMPELSALALELAARNVQVLGIGIDSAVNVRQFADKHRISYPLPVVGAAGLDWLKGLGNSGGGLPFTVVIDRHGAISTRVLGRVDIKRLREQLLNLTRG